jgi:hypothetical protein
LLLNPLRISPQSVNELFIAWRLPTENEIPFFCFADGFSTTGQMSMDVCCTVFLCARFLLVIVKTLIQIFCLSDVAGGLSIGLRLLGKNVVPGFLLE